MTWGRIAMWAADDAYAGLIGVLQADDDAEAREMVRALVDHVTLRPEVGGYRVEVRGELAAILGLALGGAAVKGGGSPVVLAEQMKMVAGTGNPLYRTRFQWPPIAEVSAHVSDFDTKGVLQA